MKSRVGEVTMNALLVSKNNSPAALNRLLYDNVIMLLCNNSVM